MQQFMDTFDVIEFGENEWALYKRIRLQSLVESPDAFSSNYTSEVALSSNDWKARLQSYNGRKVLPLWVLKDNIHVALAITVINRDDRATGCIYQMWVSKEYRGHGISKLLLDRILSWASANGLRKLALEVAKNNYTAFAVYSSFGFNPISVPESEFGKQGGNAIKMLFDITTKPSTNILNFNPY